MLHLIYQAIEAKLAPLNLYIDWYDGQYLQQGEQALSAPASIFIEFEQIQWNTLRRSTQDAVLSFRVHVVHESLAAGAQRIADAAIQHLQVVNAVYLALHESALRVGDIPAFASSADAQHQLLGSIVRTALQPDHMLSNLVATVVTFEGRHIDNSLQLSKSEQAELLGLKLNTSL